VSERLSLRTLAELMAWSDERAMAEFAWLRLMSRLKYDGYHHYLAGVRFVESLVLWLRQFDPADRNVAYALVRNRLAYVSTQEIRRLVELLYPREVEPALVRAAARRCGVPWYLVWADEKATRALLRLRRQTLFMGLSDGARMDVFRRSNVGILSNEQTVLAPLVDQEKWIDLRNELNKDPILSGVDNPKFTQLYLIDDLTASGTTLLRHNEEEAFWKGKLFKLKEAIWRSRDSMRDDFPLAEDFRVCVHHYIATRAALDAARSLDHRARSEMGAEGWFASVHFSAGLVLDDTSQINRDGDADICALVDKYYDAALENRHSAESGIRDMRFGYKACGLTLVLEHNTPNNTVPLIWAETDGENGAHAMRPLFRRRSRHT